MAAVRSGYAAYARTESAPESFWISLRYFNFYRIALAAVFLGTSLIYEEPLSLGSHNLTLFRYVSACYLVFGIVFHGVLRNLRDRFDLQLSIHVFVDIVAITLMMFASGGVSSGLGVMLLISMTGAALVAQQRLTYLYAALSTFALLLQQGYWVLFQGAPPGAYLQPSLLAIGCFASAGVTNRLARRVAANESLARRRGRELETQTRVNQLVIEDMHDGIVVLDRDGRVVQHNPRALRLLGADPLIGVELSSLLPGFAPRWRDWRAGVESAVPTGSADYELHGRGINLRLLDTGTAEEFSVLFVEDLTRTREQAQQLKLAALGRLTANIAHEIRNPLSAISHASELLGEERRARDRERLCRIILDNTQRLDRLVYDVLQLSRRDRIASERIHLNTWLMGFLEEFMANDRVPPERFQIQTMREAWVDFDREQLRQVLWNLLRNAVRYAREDPRSIRIVLGGQGDQVELSVIDNGVGVPAANQGQLFEPFFTTDSKGTGLGVYLARELSAANGAMLDYVDEAAGAHFRILCQEAGKA